ncbi:MAG TPA: carboxypeptidase-like regulatory domain-containing protein [Candidatus Thermoplasmatota archaeon]|nr:carboxypeptidase-like regulatory domain-containing protein [Candidatus Thermoplasmatota archaeon]
MRILVALLALTLAGCAADTTPSPITGGEPPATPATPPATTPGSTTPPPAVTGDRLVTVRGHVLDQTVAPIAGADVRVVGLELTTRTDTQGAFEFRKVPAGILTVQAYAPGYLPANATGPADGPFRITLQPGAPAAYQLTYAFDGYIECALEVLIISPSCDSGIVALTNGSVQAFEQNFTFPFRADLGWRSIVVDVVFQGSQNPGLDGLRIALRGLDEETPGGAYEQFGRWHAPGSFTVRVDAEAETYPYGVGPIPGNYTGFRIDAYPHGHLYHQACVPGSQTCFLGAGAGTSIRFEVFVTVFMMEPAPEGYSAVAR